MKYLPYSSQQFYHLNHGLNNCISEKKGIGFKQTEQGMLLYLTDKTAWLGDMSPKWRGQKVEGCEAARLSRVRMPSASEWMGEAGPAALRVRPWRWQQHRWGTADSRVCPPSTAALRSAHLVWAAASAPLSFASHTQNLRTGAAEPGV